MLVYMAAREQSFYYGKTTKPLHARIRRHVYDAQRCVNNSHFHKALRRYGADGFEWVELERYGSLDELNAAEQRWIALSRECGHRLYNISLGGDGGARHMQGGNVIPKERRERIAASLRAHYASRPGTMTGRKGELAPMHGRCHLDETRKKISEAHRRLDKPHLRGVNNPSSRSVICLTTGERFPLASDAAKKLGVDLSSIIKVCRGKKKSAGGYAFSYAEPGVFGWTDEGPT